MKMCSFGSGVSFYSTAWCEMWRGRIFLRILLNKRKLKTSLSRHMRRKFEKNFNGNISEFTMWKNSFKMCVSKVVAGVWGWTLRVKFSARRWQRETNRRQKSFLSCAWFKEKNFFASNCGNGNRAHHFSKRISSVSTLLKSEIKRWKNSEGWLGEGVKIGKLKRHTSDFQNGFARRFYQRS